MQVIETLPIKLSAPTAIAVGYFDGVHKAHSEVIKKAVSYSDEGLIPVVFSFKTMKDAPSKKKGALLLQTFTLKCESVEKLGAEIFLCPPFESFMDMSMEEFAVGLLAKRLKAKAVCCGYDYHFGRGASGNPTDLKRLLTPLDIKVDTIDAIMCGDTPVSSTLIRELLKDGEVDTANILLGYEFTIDFPVSHGRSFGKTMGFPTANQIFPKGVIVPRFGVYKTRVLVDGRSYLGVTNVGVKPTVGETDFVGAETYIDGFTGDLYGKSVKTSFVRYLRPETKFSVIEELKNAIAHDLANARKE